MSKAHKHNKYLEHKLYDIIREDDHNGFIANLVDTSLMILVILSVVVAFLNTFDLPSATSHLLNVLEIFFVLMFTVEYGIRLWTAEFIYPSLSPFRARLKYVFSMMAIIDLLSILPFYLPFFGVSVGSLKVIKLVRLFRIFKINRYTSSLSLIGSVLKNRATHCYPALSSSSS